MRTNTLSALGRLSYSAHLALYPIIGGSLYSLYSSYSKSSAEAQKNYELESMPKLKAVDPDNFNPFTPIPFHNNPELRYRYAGVRLHKYLDTKTQLNVNDTPYKAFHDSFDHNNKK